MRGLHCSVIGSDCTNGGVTSGRKSVTLIGDGIAGPFEPCADHPAVVLEYDLEPQGARAGQLTVAKVDWLKQIAGDTSGCGTFECMGKDWSSRHKIVRVVARPVGPDGKARTGGMFGGNFITTSDSRFPVTAPIPVHDRFE
jgi:hypothetical protein